MTFKDSRLVMEALVVGVALAAALVLAHGVVAIKDYKTAAVVGLVVGASLHLVFELLGLNRAYCSTGHACRRA